MTKTKTIFDIAKFRLGYKQRPNYVNFTVTRKCNSRCVFCNIWKESNDEPSLSEIKKNFSAIDDIKWIQLTGGEPFLRDDIVELTWFLTKKFKNIAIWIPTNGISTKQIVTSVESMPDNVSITVSLDGKRETHNAQRGGNFYDKTIKTIKELSKLENKSTIGFTISEKNYTDIAFVYGLSEKYGFNFSCRPVNYSEVYYKNKENEKSLFSDEAISEIGGFLKTLSSNRRDKLYHKSIIEYMKFGRTTVPCTAFRNSFFINEKMQIFPCVFINQNMGKLEDLKEIWQSKKANGVRKQIKKLNCPNCCVECETCRNITYYIERAIF